MADTSEERILTMENDMQDKAESTKPARPQENGCSAEMPRYLCHKKVWALKISGIKRDGEGENRETDGSAMITPLDPGYAPFRVDHAYMHKHKPEVGGYYVVYDDGYKSFSPCKAFEDGYERI